MIKDFFILTLRNLRKRKARSLLTMLGIFIAIATIFTLISLSLGLESAVEAQFQKLGADKFFIIPKSANLGQPGALGGETFTEEHVRVVEKGRGVKRVTYFTLESAKVEYKDTTRYFTVIGLPPDRLDLFLESLSFTLDEGRMIKDGETFAVTLGSRFKYDDLYPEAIRAGDTILINDLSFKVRGIASPIGNPQDDSNIFIPLDTLREVFQVPNRIDEMVVQVEEGTDVRLVAEGVEKDLRKYKDQTEKTQDFFITTPEEILNSFKAILNIITYFLAGVAAISLLVGGIGIANTMYTSVLERTKEIGVMKAIGAKNSDILTIFLIESGLLGLIGATIGVLLGYGASKTIELVVTTLYDTTLLQVSAPGYLIFGCLLFGFLIGAISGILPAYQASKTNVVQALRFE